MQGIAAPHSRAVPKNIPQPGIDPTAGFIIGTVLFFSVLPRKSDLGYRNAEHPVVRLASAVVFL
jgi:hypothetical protein